MSHDFSDEHLSDTWSHYITTVGDACSSAAAGGLAVDILLADGNRIAGVPAPRAARGPHDELHETGYARILTVDKTIVRLDQIVACTLLAPVGTGG